MYVPPYKSQGKACLGQGGKGAENVTNSRLPRLDANSLDQVVSTLTKPRLSKYLRASKNNSQQALRLYVLNTSVSAAFLADLHYVEVALRNKFDRELSALYGPEWFKDPGFLGLVDPYTQVLFGKARKAARKNMPKGTPKGAPIPPGKVVAEVTFGIWAGLTDRQLEHSLWVPCLHKAFAPRKPPKRSTFNSQLEKLRQLRNRVAHHEPIFHLDLLGTHKLLREVAALLCPMTASVMTSTSLVRREVMALTRYCQKRDI